MSARPVQAALTSAAAFSIGVAFPLSLALVAPADALAPAVATGSPVFLAILGAVGARTGGANIVMVTVRVTF